MWLSDAFVRSVKMGIVSVAAAVVPPACDKKIRKNSIKFSTCTNSLVIREILC